MKLLQVHTRQVNVREIFFFFKVREFSGNFILCQGKMSGYKLNYFDSISNPSIGCPFTFSKKYTLMLVVIFQVKHHQVEGKTT